MYVIAAVGCGVPIPDMPGYVGERDGIEYYMEPSVDLTIDQAHLLVKTAVNAWGADASSTKGLKIGVYSSYIQCSGGPHTGCYWRTSQIDIIQLMYIPRCPYHFPIGHELWHYLYVRDREPTMAEYAQIAKVDEEVYKLLPESCYR
jgi:hypothetical protein